MYAVEVHNIKKNYFSKKSGKFAGVDMQQPLADIKVSYGELFGLIGPDGAGKTTLFRIMTTLILPDSGNAKVLGLDVIQDYKTIRCRIGYMPGRFSLYPDLTVEENLKFYASIFGTTIIENYYIIEDIYSQIEPFKKRKAAKLSGGMKQKLALCCALIHKPEVLFLDEPTTGVDPVSRKEFWAMLHRLKNDGITIIVSTPYMDEAAVCDRIALMREGRFLNIGSPEEIIADNKDAIWGVSSDNMYKLLKDLRNYRYIEKCYTFGEELHFTITNDDRSALENYLKENGHSIIGLHRIMPTIEDCFMNLSGK